jgi:hypothetical protein
MFPSSGKMNGAAILLGLLERAKLNHFILPDDGNRSSFRNVFFRTPMVGNHFNLSVDFIVFILQLHP